MRRFEKRKRWQKIVFSKLSLLGMALLVILLGRAAYSAYGKYESSGGALEQTREEYETLKNREAALEASMERLNSPGGEEEELRRKFNVAHPGEEVIIIVDE